MKSVAKTPHGIAATQGIAHGLGATSACIAAFAVGAALAVGTGIAAASPPAARAGILIRTTDGANRSSGVVRNERELGRLDLRAPTDFAGAPAAASNSGPADSATGPVPFPSARRAPKSESVEDQLPSLGHADPAVKITSRAEELTQRFHREGLPLARLWQTRSAMLSLGLSPRGKPGIWLIQKIP